MAINVTLLTDLVILSPFDVQDKNKNIRALQCVTLVDSFI